MAYLQELTPPEIEEALGLLVGNNLLVSLTSRYQGRWVTLRTRAIAEHGRIVWVAKPPTDHLSAAFSFRQGEQLGVSFNAARRKFVFSAKVIAEEGYSLDGEAQATALRLLVPDQMHKVERRLHQRVDLSNDELSRASFWLGGWDARPDGSANSAPVWSGRVLNLSAGGLLVRASIEAAKYMEVGDVVGLNVTFGAEEEAADVDAQFRHCVHEGEMALIGLQFIESDSAGSQGLDVILRKIEREARRQDRN